LKRRKKGRKINGTNLALESWVAIAGAVVSRLFLGILEGGFVLGAINP
jgi:hypothetical protein